jgi:hypothetical protein
MSISHNLSIDNMKPLARNPQAMLDILLELDKGQGDNGLAVITSLHHGLAALRLDTTELDMFSCVT